MEKQEHDGKDAVLRTPSNAVRMELLPLWGATWLRPQHWSQEPRVHPVLCTGLDSSFILFKAVRVPSKNLLRSPPQPSAVTLPSWRTNKSTLDLVTSEQRDLPALRALLVRWCTSAPRSRAGTCSQIFSDVIVYGDLYHWSVWLNAFRVLTWLE